MNNIIIKFSLCIKVWRVFKLKTDDIDDGGKLLLSFLPSVPAVFHAAYRPPDAVIKKLGENILLC